MRNQGRGIEKHGGIQVRCIAVPRFLDDSQREDGAKFSFTSRSEWCRHEYQRGRVDATLALIADGCHEF